MATETFVSRYYIDNDSLRRAALALQVGQGTADRLNSNEGTEFIAKAEDWVEQQISEFIYVPLKPVRAPGQSTSDFVAAVTNNSLTRRNFPVDFIEAVIYRALELMLNSEFSENQGNTSALVEISQKKTREQIVELRDRLSTNVGCGRRRHPNVHMPPTIAPKQQRQSQ